MASFSSVVLFIMLLVNVSAVRVSNESFNVKENISEQELLKKLLEDVETMMLLPSEQDLERASEQAALQKLSYIPESMVNELLAEPVLNIEKMAASISDGGQLDVSANAVVGPIMREDEKETGLRASGVGPMPLKHWLDSFVGEARRIVWSVGPRFKE